MKLGLLALPAAFLLTIAALAVGCGGSSDALTLDEYFEQFEAIDADVDAQIGEAFADFPEDVSDEEFFADDANLPLMKDLIAVFPLIVGDAVDSYEDLEPPSEVEDAHDDLVAAGQDLRAVFEEAAGNFDEVDTMAAAFQANVEMETVIDAATTRFDNACLALVDIAEANDIAVNVTCEE